MKTEFELVDWTEIHYLIVEAILTRRMPRVDRVENGEEGPSSGQGALMELSYDLTKKFYDKYADEDLDGDEFNDAFDEFIEKELQ